MFTVIPLEAGWTILQICFHTRHSKPIGKQYMIDLIFGV
jgi:hypothetical protein